MPADPVRLNQRTVSLNQNRIVSKIILTEWNKIKAGYLHLPSLPILSNAFIEPHLPASLPRHTPLPDLRMPAVLVTEPAKPYIRSLCPQVLSWPLWDFLTPLPDLRMPPVPLARRTSLHAVFRFVQRTV